MIPILRWFVLAGVIALLLPSVSRLQVAQAAGEDTQSVVRRQQILSGQEQIKQQIAWLQTLAKVGEVGQE
jgi:hypothetical protein